MQPRNLFYFSCRREGPARMHHQVKYPRAEQPLPTNSRSVMRVELGGSTSVLVATDGSVVGIFSDEDLLGIPRLMSHIRECVVEELRRLRQADQVSSPSAERYATLTARERQVMNFLVAAKPTKQIARQLGISHKTAEHHRSSILRKMQVESTGELIRLALSDDGIPGS